MKREKCSGDPCGRQAPRRKTGIFTLIHRPWFNAFGGIQALEMCSLSVEQETITGLIGPNRSGKTTLFNIMTGYERIDTGMIQFQGQAITDLAPHWAVLFQRYKISLRHLRKDGL